MTGDAAHPPDGFRLLDIPTGRATGFNPIAFHARRAGTALAMGFRVGASHLNPGGRCHGGVLATFCDMHLAFAVLFETPELSTTILPTVSLDVDFLAGVPAGAWVEATGGVITVTRNLAFTQAIVLADGTPAVRANGTFKVGGARVTSIDTGAWLRAQVDRP